MDSLEIADLTGKRHDNVLTDIKKMLTELELHAPDFSGTQKYGNNNTREVYNLPKRETMILVSGYNLVMRAKIIDRWQELEAHVAKPLTAAEMFLQSAQTMLMLEQRTALMEKQQQEVKQNVAVQANKLLKVESAISEVKETNLLTSCPSAAESITGIRLRMNEDYGLSASVVDAVMRQSLYAPKPVGMVRNQHESSGGSTYAVYWKKDVSTVFKMFVGECKQAKGSVRFTHPFVTQNFKLIK